MGLEPRVLARPILCLFLDDSDRITSIGSGATESFTVSRPGVKHVVLKEAEEAKTGRHASLLGRVKPQL